jgi:sugar phosphate isomerase/epimerase
MRSAFAADPVVRNGKPFFKLSMAAYSYRDELTGKPPRITLEDFIRICADFNLDGCELTSYYFPSDITPEYLQRIKNLAFSLGLDITGTAIGNDFCVADPAELEKQIAHTKKWIDYAAAFGAPVMRIFAGSVPSGDTEAASIARCTAAINRVLPYAAEKGVVLALENHGGITSTPAQMLAIIKQVEASPWFGVNLDGGNFRTDDPYRDLAEMAPYAVNVQLKTDIVVSGRKTDADLPRIIEILASANYRGYVVLEYEGSEPVREAAPRHIARLKQLLGRDSSRP